MAEPPAPAIMPAPVPAIATAITAGETPAAPAPTETTATLATSPAGPSNDSDNGDNDDNGDNGDNGDNVDNSDNVDNGDNGDNAPTASTAAPQEQQQLKERHQQPATIARPPPPQAPAPTSGRRKLKPRSQPQPQPQEQHFHPYYSLTPETNRDRFYNILNELDPYGTTPREFIHILAHAASRDQQIAEALFRLNRDRINNPNTWHPPTPPIPPYFAWSGAPIPTNHPPNAFFANMFAAPLPGQEDATPPVRPRKRQRNEGAEQHATPTPATSRSGANSQKNRMVMYPGPQPPPPVPYPGQPQNPIIVQVDAATAQMPSRGQSSKAGQRGVPCPTAPPVAPPIISAQSVADSATNVKDKGIEPIDGEPNELPCNYTYILDRAETHLGFTGMYDKTSDIRQTSIGYEVALKLQKMLKKFNTLMDKHVTLANRVHVLTVMREIIAATLEAERTVGKECRECSREFDSTYLAAIRKLTPEQLRRLKSLEDGKWLEEMQELVTEAKRQSMFPLLERALAHLNSAI
ncbi:hypothetical protein F4803DRAFT_462760 [Xylaria telfairii]|nr:hypothetical protein F4803DRAFT_462760 [Xylaria telfairii]